GPGREAADGGRAGDVGEDRALGAVDLVAQVEAAAGGPRELAVGDAAGGELEDEEGVVLALGFLMVDAVGATGHDFDDLVVFPEGVAGHFDRMAAEVGNGAAAGVADVPE